MSLFRKPTKKIQRRVFAADDDEDETGEPEPPPPPIISKKKENNASKATALLSFADEEDDGEVFKVKKSSQSKRLSKKRDKEKRLGNDSENKNNKSNIPEEQPSDNQELQRDTEPKKSKKKVSLEGLILSGRAALAADGTGDISDGDAGDEDDEMEEGGFHRFRAENVRAALAAGDVIPDAALIHAARKTRQQAREQGADFIPVRDGGEQTKPGSRLVRDDDGSGDDEDRRIIVRGLELPSDKPQRDTAAAASDAEVDSEVEQWEEQQMQKAVPAIADAMDGTDMNPFAVAPPPPRLQDAPPHLRPLPLAALTARNLLDALHDRLQELQVARDAVSSNREEMNERLLRASTTRDTCRAKCRQLEDAYKSAQAARGYVADLLECLDDKMPQIEALESRALALHRKRCEFIQERRRADVRDQAQDVMALIGRQTGVRPPDSEEKVRRAAEREGRRRARRLRREASNALVDHREGDSTDDDLPPDMAAARTKEAEEIRRLSSTIFSDALGAWRSVRGVCVKLARLRRAQPALYADAYIADCLPKLLAPYVRHQLIMWNPLADEDNEDYEKMDWYKCATMYGVRPAAISSDSEDSDRSDTEWESRPVTERSTAEDTDLMLVPQLMQRVVLPKITELVEHAWDPMCVAACIRLRGLILRACALPTARPALRRLAAAATKVLAHTIAADVYIPAVPDWTSGPAGAFWRQRLGAGVRLFRAALALSDPPPLAAHRLAAALLQQLCTALAMSGGGAAAAAAALAAAVPRQSPLRPAALARLAALAERATQYLNQNNPKHLKLLEQARTVIAEAKAAAEND